MKTSSKKQVIATVGSSVVDIFSDDVPASGKSDGRISFCLGGGAVNTARAAQKLVGITPILMCGNDPLRPLADHLAQQELENVMQWNCMEKTRCSLITGNSLVTRRSSIQTPRIPEAISQACSSSSLLIVAPMTEKDYPVTRRLLTLNSNSILQLSRNQLGNAGMSLNLAREAMLTIINDSEAAIWTGFSDPIRAIQWLRDRKVVNVIITSKNAVNGYCDNNWVYVPAYQIEEAKSTIGAGDVFAGTLAAILVTGKVSWKNAIKLAMTAAALHIEQTAVKGMTHLQAVSLKRKSTAFQKPVSKQPTYQTTGIAILATSLVLAMTLGFLL